MRSMLLPRPTLTFIKKDKAFKEGIYATIILWVILLTSIIVTVHYKNPLFFRLYFEFFKTGLCAFGGGLATIPFLKELGFVYR